MFWFCNPTTTALSRLERTLMAALDDLTREVTETRTAIDSAIVLIEGLKTRLDDAIATGDMSQVQALSDSLSSDTDRLAAAVTANTPVENPAPEGTIISTPGDVTGDAATLRRT